MASPPSWAATQRGPAQYRPQTGGSSSGDSYDGRGLPPNIARVASNSPRMPPNNMDGAYQPQQQQPSWPQQDQPHPTQAYPSPPQPRSTPQMQRNSSFHPLAMTANQAAPTSGPAQNGSQPASESHRRTQSLRPFSAFQPLEQPDPYQPPSAASGASPASPARPSSPTGSTTRSIRTAAAPLTFKSPELRSALSLQDAQQRKIYMEGYLSRRDALGADGKPLRAGDPKKAWHLCFVQLSGTVLSVWSVRQMEDAAREGREVPPSYINVTDSFVDLVGNLIEDPNEVPGSRGRYENVFALNSAGNNRVLFCVEGAVGRRLVQAWVNGIRLASWEKARLEEIYTGALIRARLGAAGGASNADNSPMQGPPSATANVSIVSPLAKGRMEGWVKARFMGSTEWRKCWLVLTKDKPEEGGGVGKKLWQKLGGAGDRSSVLSIGSSTPPSPNASGAQRIASTSGTGPAPDIEPPPGNNGASGVAQFFEGKKHKKPFATMVYGAHAFAVYPSRPELVEGSSLFKVEGAFPQSQVLSATNRIRQTGWVMIMPELEAGSRGANAEMMKWVIAFMDAFRLYGRPDGFVWDARNPASAFFAYPIGPYKDRLFLDRELAEFLDVREERHLACRTNLHGIMAARMRGERTPVLPPLPTPNTAQTRQLNGDGSGQGDDRPNPQTQQSTSAPALPEMAGSLPPMDFGDSSKDGQSTEKAAGNGQACGARPTGLDAIGEQPSREGTLAAASTATHGPTLGASANVTADTLVDPGYGRPDQRADVDVQPTSPQRSGDFDSQRGLNQGFDQARVDQQGAGPQPARQNAASPVGPGSPTQASILSYARSASPDPPRSNVSGAAPPLHAQRTRVEGIDRIRSHPQSVQSAAPESQAEKPINSSRAQDQHIAAANEAAEATAVPGSPASSKPAPVLAPSGRGAEANQKPSQEAADKRPSEADFSSAYDEGALFYLRSMSDQLPAPTPAVKPVQPLRPAVDTAVPQVAALATASDRQAHDSPAVDTPSSYTQPSYAPSQPGMSQASTIPAHDATDDRLDEDALAAYSFLDQPPSPGALARGRSLSNNQRAVPVRADGQGAAPSEAVASKQAPLAAPVASRPTPVNAYPSTFGQNKRAQDRKEAAQAQAAAHAEALSKPGKPGGKKKGLKPKAQHAWGGESSEDEEDEEEDEDEEEEEQARQARDRAAATTPSGQASLAPPQQQPQNSSTDSEHTIGGLSEQAARTAAAAAGLPPPGKSASPSGGSLYGGGYSGRGSPVQAGAGTSGASSPGPGPHQLRAGGAHPALVSHRQSVFSTHLGAPHVEDDARSISPSQAGSTNGGRQTFVQLNPQEQPGSMTAVFQPHGLLQAGASDKAERSAKHQEMEARMAGVGMVNVPSKPPPPQAGLLGAITAHERDRKGAGGLGATLTERERQRVDAERRQREEDAMRMSQNGGGMPGMPQGQWPGMMGGYNPFMWQQMMMMNPMMMGMGMPGYGGSQMGHGGGSPPPPGPQMDPYMQQQMAAAMAAQQAYMQAVSQQGHGGGASMVGGEGAGGSPKPGHVSQSPSMAGMGPMGPMGGMGGMGGMSTMGSMNGFPHPMSMYGMPSMMGGMMGGGGMGYPMGPSSEFGAMSPQQNQGSRRREGSTDRLVQNGSQSPLRR